MAVYFAMIFFSSGCAYFACRSSRPLRDENGLYTDHSFVSKLFIFLSFCFPFLVSALRYDVGTDYSGTYTSDYFSIKSGYRTRTELIFYWLYKLCIAASGNKQLFFFVTSLLFTAGVFRVIYRYSADPPMSVFLLFASYVFFTSMNAVRQYIAMVFVYNFLDLLKNKKYIRFAAVVIIAVFLHRSAVVFLSFIPMYIITSKPRTVLTASVIGTGLIAVFARTRLFYDIMTLLKYNIYLGTGSRSGNGISAVSAAVNAVIYLAAFLLLRDKTDKDRYANFFLNIQLVSVIICLFGNVIPLAIRLLQMFEFGRIFLLPAAIYYCKKRGTKIFMTLGVSLLFLLWMIHGLNSNWDSVVPYRTNPDGVL